MKNKVLATLMSVCLFAGMAVPAFAVTTSTQSGQNSDITKGVFLKDNYELANGADKKMGPEIRAFVSTRQLTQSPDINWAVENLDDKFAFYISTEGKVEAREDSGSANIIARLNDGTIVAKTTIKATPRKKTVWATGYSFKNSTETMLLGAKTLFINNDSGLATRDATTDVLNANGVQNFKIVPAPAGAVFTEAQVKAITDTINNGSDLDITVNNNVGGPVTVQAIASVNGDYNEITVSYAASTFENASTYDYKLLYAPNTGDRVSIAGVEVTFSDAGAAGTAAAAIELVDQWKARANDEQKAKWSVAVTDVDTDSITFTEKEFGYKTAPGVAKVTTTTAVGAKFSVGSIVAGSVGQPDTKAETSEVTNFAAVTAKKFDKQVKTININFPRPNDDRTSGMLKRSVNVYGTEGAISTYVNAATKLTVKVGEKLNVEKYFKQGNSAANITFPVSYSNDYVDQNAEFSDYAIVLDSDDVLYADKGDILGVHVGSNKIQADAVTPTGVKTASFIVDVAENVNYGVGNTPAPTEATLSFSTANTTVGGAGFTVTVKNVPEGATITFSSEDSSVATVDANGKVTGVAAGTTKIVASVNGSPLYCTVTVKAATVAPPVTPSTPDAGTDVPKTGTALIAPLF